MNRTQILMMGNNNSKTIAVFGGSRVPPGSAEYKEAFAVGQLLARAGFTMVNGGYAGAMEASARGARESGGRVVGVISGEFGWLTPNPYLDETIRHDDLFSRIREMQARADGFVVLKGSMGTLAELALVWNLAKIQEHHRKPIVLLGKMWNHVLQSWREHLAVTEEETQLLYVANSPSEAIEYMKHAIGNHQHPLPRSPSPTT